jgi:siderophore synthetase component
MRPFVATALALALLPLAALAARTTEMKSPVTIALATKASAAQVKKAVKTAVLARQWQISNEKGNEFDATYTRTDRNGTLMAKIHVAHSPKQVTIKYVASEGLSAEGSQIHPTYNKWIGNLEKDIPIYVEREVVASE